ncbi:MAG: VOC family protein [Rhodothalassiaceae bacterium]
MNASTPFHLAFPVDDLAAAEKFYTGTLGCRIGRRAPHWIDFDFFGHQITAHLRPEECRAAATNPVDGDAVPVRHFGAVLAWADWDALTARLEAAGIDFLIRPHIRFRGKAGEQGTFFIRDPAGNALEFKTFRDRERLFAPGKADDHA